MAILVAVWWTLVTTFPTHRLAFAGVAALLIVVQLGPVVFRIHQNAYKNDWLPAIAVARPFVEQKLLVMAGPEFAMPFNFPENVVNRPDYGYRSGGSPALVLTSVGQLERNTALTTKDPQFHHYMTVTFFQLYRPIYQRGDVAVYRSVR